MRLATWDHAGATHSGVVVTGERGDGGDRVHAFPGGQRGLDAVRLGLDGLLALGAEAVEASPGLPLAQVRLRAPLDPPTVRDFVAFEEHVEGVVRSVVGPEGTVVPQWYELPTFYFTNPYAIVATGEEVAIPHGCSAMDFELEVAAVIGRSGRDLDPGSAHEHVIGYTVLNDWSARDLQGREMQVSLGPAKGKDFASTLGPWLVTADELEPYLDGDGFLELGMTVAVNGVEVGRDLLSNMGWPFGDLVAYASRDTWVHPGDVIGSGTCGNGGCLAELWGRNLSPSGERTPPPLRPGDQVTMTVEGIGTISNRLVAGPPTPAVPPARPRPRRRPSRTLGAPAPGVGEA